MSAVRSTASFDEKLKEYGLAQKSQQIKEKGWTTMAAFAMSCGYNPESTTDDKFVTKVIGPLCGGWDGQGEEPVLANNIRQLYWECLQSVIADTRHKHDYTMEDQPRPVSGP